MRMYKQISRYGIFNKKQLWCDPWRASHHAHHTSHHTYFLLKMAKWPKLGQFWPKRAIFEFSNKMWKRHFLSTPETRLSTKNYKILMNGLQKKNAKNLHFWEIESKMANFGNFLAKTSKTGIFLKKALVTFFHAYKP